MSVTINKATRIGYAQVEPNHMSAGRDGRVYAQTPAAADITVIEQGTFFKIDATEVNFTADGPWYMALNEEQLYDERHQMHRDYAMKAEDFFDGKLFPRLLGIVEGDTFTTNNVADGTYAAGDKLKIEDGILTAGSAADGDAAFQVIKETTMPDGQPAVKVRVIAA